MIEAALLSTLLDFQIWMRNRIMNEWGRELDMQRRVSVMPDYVYMIIFIQKWLIYEVEWSKNNDPKLTFLRQTIPWSFGKIIIDICWCTIKKQQHRSLFSRHALLALNYSSSMHQHYSDCLILAYVTHLIKRFLCLRCLQNVQCT